MDRTKDFASSTFNSRPVKPHQQIVKTDHCNAHWDRLQDAVPEQSRDDPITDSSEETDTDIAESENSFSSEDSESDSDSDSESTIGSHSLVSNPFPSDDGLKGTNHSQDSRSENQTLLPVTSIKTTGHDSHVSDLELGYEEPIGMDQAIPLPFDDVQDAARHDDPVEEEDQAEHIALWERIPLGLTIASVLFSGSLLICLRVAFLYLLQSHGWVYTAFCVSTIAGAFLLSVYIVLNTFWFTQMDLDRALARQEKARLLLRDMYPEHLIQKILPDDEEEEEEKTAEGFPSDHIEQWLPRLVQEEEQLQDPCPPSGDSDASAPTGRAEQLLTNMTSLYGAIGDLGLQRRASMATTLSQLTMQNCIVPVPPALVRQSSNRSLLDYNSAMGCGNSTHGSVASGGEKSTHQQSLNDLFPNTTVFYAEIVGFTAWSSQRTPNQVFDLLQSVFGEMDQQAKRAGVFKVESMADCYIAVTGLPNADPRHAVRMAQFASDCLDVFETTTEALERALGPDTAELQLRVGLNSGPVTAGVLMGANSRFQLFGDTLNNAIRVEKEGQGNRVHITRDTAELLQAAGKDHWMTLREKSKTGKTFWLTAAQRCHKRASCSHTVVILPPSQTTDDDLDHQDSFHNDAGDDNHSRTSQETGHSTLVSSAESVDTKQTWTMHDVLTAKEQRLIEWTVDQLALMLQKIIARRKAIQRYEEKTGRASSKADGRPAPSLHYTPSDQNKTVLDEVQEMVVIPRYNDALLQEDALQDFESTELPELALEELTNFVTTVTTFYFDSSRNPFHNFMHASHVLMSVVKMMQRIVSPSQMAMEKNKKNAKKGRRGRKNFNRSLSWEELHDHTFGITTDPLTQFAVVFAALIHDLDHPGVPNAQLVKEGTRLARIYKNRSISEQNSLDMAWDLLMDPSYQNLVRTICSSQDELKRFRQLLVQTVMATDIADAELRSARNVRWDKAFKEVQPEEENGNNEIKDQEHSDVDKQQANKLKFAQAQQVTEDDKNRKATIVLEHLMQASDIAHTMQHWEVFRKWNEKLYREMYLAYLHGRAEKDPVEFWYKGEIGFFKFYIIPLAKKLSDCGVFGVSSDEYLNYAEQNLEIWETKGEEVVGEISEAVYQDYGTKEDVLKCTSYS